MSCLQNVPKDAATRLRPVSNRSCVSGEAELIQDVTLRRRCLQEDFSRTIVLTDADDCSDPVKYVKAGVVRLQDTKLFLEGRRHGSVSRK